MSSSLPVWGVRVFSVVALVGWGMVVLYMDPETGGNRARSFFYGTFFLWSSSFFGLCLWEIRKLFDGDARLKRIRSIRQGLFLAFFAASVLMLQELRVLFWWDAALVAAGLLLVELWGYKKEERGQIKNFQ